MHSVSKARQMWYCSLLASIEILELAKNRYTIRGVPPLISRSWAGIKECFYIGLRSIDFVLCPHVERVSLADRCLHSDCAERCNHALWH